MPAEPAEAMHESTNERPSERHLPRPLPRPPQPFYVTGLPKSRTAWLSVALSDYRLCACLHEPLARMHDYSAATVTAALSAARTPFAGISDTGLAIVAPNLPAELPGPMVVVLRDADDVAESLARYFPDASLEVHMGGVALMLDRLHALVARYDPLVVDFYDLGRNDVMRRVWEHLLPGTTYQRRRIESLQRLMIEPIPERLLDGVSDEAQQAVIEGLAGAAAVAKDGGGPQ